MRSCNDVTFTIADLQTKGDYNRSFVLIHQHANVGDDVT